MMCLCTWMSLFLFMYERGGKKSKNAANAAHCVCGCLCLSESVHVSASITFKQSVPVDQDSCHSTSFVIVCFVVFHLSVLHSNKTQVSLQSSPLSSLPHRLVGQKEASTQSMIGGDILSQTSPVYNLLISFFCCS